MMAPKNYRSMGMLFIAMLIISIQITAQNSRPDGFIVIGEINSDSVEAVEEAQPIADYLAANLSDYDIDGGSVVVAESIDEMIELFEDGEVDLVFDSVFPATVISDATGAEIFIRRWKKGVEEYHTVIFASADSDITSVDDLTGNTIAFEDDFSTSGYVLPYVHLFQEELSLSEKDDVGDSVDSDEVGFVFSGSEENILSWVFFGRVEAGALENLTFEELDPGLLDQLIILAETETMPRHVGLMNADLAPELAEAITDLLLNAHENEEGQEALEAFADTARFDTFPDGIEEATTRMRELLTIIEEQTETSDEPSGE